MVEVIIPHIAEVAPPVHVSEPHEDVSKTPSAVHQDGAAGMHHVTIAPMNTACADNQPSYHPICLAIAGVLVVLALTLAYQTTKANRRTKKNALRRE